MNEYWKKRNSELLKIHAQKADDIERELIKEYERSLNGIKKRLKRFTQGMRVKTVSVWQRHESS